MTSSAVTCIAPTVFMVDLAEFPRMNQVYGTFCNDDPFSVSVRACLAALEVLARVETRNDRRRRLGLEPWELRVGVHTGAVMSGVVGKSEFTDDIWGGRRERRCADRGVRRTRAADRIRRHL